MHSSSSHICATKFILSLYKQQRRLVDLRKQRSLVRIYYALPIFSRTCNEALFSLHTQQRQVDLWKQLCLVRVCHATPPSHTDRCVAYTCVSHVPVPKSYSHITCSNVNSLTFGSNATSYVTTTHSSPSHTSTPFPLLRICDILPAISHIYYALNPLARTCNDLHL